MKNLINNGRLVSTFMDMVKIDSESGSEDKFAKFLLQNSENLVDESWEDKHGNVYLFIKGHGDGIMFNTHMDTVSPGIGIKPRIVGETIKSSGNTILGADSKAGIAGFFELLTIIKEQKLKTRDILITLTRNEESGIPTADKIISKIKTCVVPDRGTPIGEIITSAPTARVFELHISGKTSYATTDFEKGEHAILAGAEIISTLKIGNFAKESVANIGIINGGEMTTTIPKYCYIKGNVYSFSDRNIDNFLKELNKIVTRTDNRFGTRTKVLMLEEFKGFKINENDHLLNLTRSAMIKSGIKPKMQKYMAVSNANLLNSIGVQSVLIGTGVKNQHSVNESISIRDLSKLTEILLNISVAETK